MKYDECHQQQQQDDDEQENAPLPLHSQPPVTRIASDEEEEAAVDGHPQPIRTGSHENLDRVVRPTPQDAKNRHPHHNHAAASSGEDSSTFVAASTEPPPRRRRRGSSLPPMESMEPSEYPMTTITIGGTGHSLVSVLTTPYECSRMNRSLSSLASDHIPNSSQMVLEERVAAPTMYDWSNPSTRDPDANQEPTAVEDTDDGIMKVITIPRYPRSGSMLSGLTYVDVLEDSHHGSSHHPTERPNPPVVPKDHESMAGEDPWESPILCTIPPSSNHDHDDNQVPRNRTGDSRRRMVNLVPVEDDDDVHAVEVPPPVSLPDTSRRKDERLSSSEHTRPNHNHYRSWRLGDNDLESLVPPTRVGVVVPLNDQEEEDSSRSSRFNLTKLRSFHSGSTSTVVHRHHPRPSSPRPLSTSKEPEPATPHMDFRPAIPVRPTHWVSETSGHPQPPSEEEHWKTRIYCPPPPGGGRRRKHSTTGPSWLTAPQRRSSGDTTKRSRTTNVMNLQDEDWQAFFGGTNAPPSTTKPTTKFYQTLTRKIPHLLHKVASSRSHHKKMAPQA